MRRETVSEFEGTKKDKKRVSTESRLVNLREDIKADDRELSRNTYGSS